MTALSAQNALSQASGDHPQDMPDAPVLVVDLDGTLVCSDMLHESFWSAFGRNWRSPFRAIAALMGGRAALKRLLSEASHIDVATLPYNEAVLDHIRDWRAGGGRTALVTAADQGLADRIAAHLGLFDETHGSDGRTNLKGSAKAAFLTSHFGAGRFAYMGDATADLVVWAEAGAIITVNAPAALARKAEALGKPIEHIVTAEPILRPLLKAMRPHQWLKNVLVFVPILAAHRFDTATLLLGVLAFAAFSMVASGVYLLNDLLDLGPDRAHPRKRMRPFASGALPVAMGTWLAPTFILAGLCLSIPLGLPFVTLMGCYFVLTTAYSLHLKRQIVIDICVLAGLYTLRIMAGGVATGITLSVWLFAFAIFFFFALAAVKRQAELVDLAQRGKLAVAGRGYHVDDLPIISMIALGAGFVSVLVFALYLTSPDVRELYAQPATLWGVFVIQLYWVTRIVLITHRGQMHDDPVVYAVKDKTSRICLLAAVGFIFGGTLL